MGYGRLAFASSRDSFLGGLGLARTPPSCMYTCTRFWAETGGDVPPFVLHPPSKKQVNEYPSLYTNTGTWIYWINASNSSVCLLRFTWMEPAAPMTALRRTDPGAEPSTMAVRNRPRVLRLFFFSSKAMSADMSTLDASFPPWNDAAAIALLLPLPLKKLEYDTTQTHTQAKRIDHVCVC